MQRKNLKNKCQEFDPEADTSDVINPGNVQEDTKCLSLECCLDCLAAAI
jgi:hypothetical protein